MAKVDFPDADRPAEGDVFVTLDEVKSKQIHQPLFIDADLSRPIETLQSTFFIEACFVQPDVDALVIAPFDFIAKHRLRVTDVLSYI